MFFIKNYPFFSVFFVFWCEKQQKNLINQYNLKKSEKRLKKFKKCVDICFLFCYIPTHAPDGAKK